MPDPHATGTRAAGEPQDSSNSAAKVCPSCQKPWGVIYDLGQYRCRHCGVTHAIPNRVGGTANAELRGTATGSSPVDATRNRVPSASVNQTVREAIRRSGYRIDGPNGVVQNEHDLAECIVAELRGRGFRV